MRLIRRNRQRTGSLAEDDCYDHSYGEHVSDHVDVVHLEPTERRIEIPEVDDGHHVSTDRLKRQFEERLAARARRRRPRAG